MFFRIHGHNTIVLTYQTRLKPGHAKTVPDKISKSQLHLPHKELEQNTNDLLVDLFFHVVQEGSGGFG